MDRKKILFGLGLFCARRKWLTLALCLLFTLVMGYFAAQIEINLGMLSLIDKNDPEFKLVDYANNNFGGMDYTFLAVTADTLPDAKRFTDLLAEEFQKNDLVLRVVAKIDTDALLKYGFLYLEPDQIQDFRKFAEENQNRLVEMFDDVHASPFLNAFNGMLEQQIIEKDEISDPEAAKKQLESFDNFIRTVDLYFEKGSALGPYKLKKSLGELFQTNSDDKESGLKDEYVLSKDEKSILLLLMPSEAGDDMVFTSKMMAYLESTIEQVGQGIPGAHVDIAGNVPIMRDEHQAIIRDTRLSTIVTFLLVLVIFFYFFRRFSDLLLIGICLATGIVWTYAVTHFYIGFLGVTTAFFSAILLGLGIDFAIHIIARYSECIKEGLPVDESIAYAIAGSGPGIITGALTTAMAFYVLMVCHFKGISQLGFVAGTGILSMMVIMFTLLPAMISIRDGRKKNQREAAPMRELNLFSNLAGYMIRHRLPAVIIVLVFTALTAIASSEIRFNYDFRSLEPRGGKAVAANHKLEKEFGKSLDYGLVFADSVEESRELTKKLEAKKSFAEIHDISEYIPLDQDKKRPLIQAIEPILAPVIVEEKPGAEEPMPEGQISEFAKTLDESVRMVKAVKQLAIVGGDFEIEDKCTEVMENIRRLSEKLALKPSNFVSGGSYFQQTLGKELDSLLGNLKIAAKAEPLDVPQLPEVVRNNFIGDDGRFLIYAYPTGYIWTRDRLNALREDLRSVTPDSTSIGMVFMILVDKIKLDFRFAIWLSLAIVFLLILIDFKKLPTAVMALIPLVLGAVWMVGTMVLLGLTFNLINVAVVPLIIGIGIDNGVHIIHRYRSEDSDKIRLAVQHTGRAIFLSSITTMAGFGSLGLASYIAVATLGWVLVIGIVYCFFTSVVVLPILLSLLEKKFGNI